MTTPSDAERRLRCRIRWWIGFFIAGLVLSGLTAIPIYHEVRWLVQITGADQIVKEAGPNLAPAWAWWLHRVDRALEETHRKHLMLFYGTDWLAFGHLVLALAFVGAWRDPVRNVWLFHFGLLACALVVPWAFAWGAVRGIPVWWRLIDCSFGVFGAMPLWLALTATRRLEALARQKAPSPAC